MLPTYGLGDFTKTFDQRLEESLESLSVKDKNGKRYFLIVPCDHRVSLGPADGVHTIDDINRLAVQLYENHGTALLAHVGVINKIRKYRGNNPGIATITHLNGETGAAAKHPNIGKYKKTLVTSVEEAILAGSRGVSVHVNVTSHDEPDQFSEFYTAKQQRLVGFKRFGVVPAEVMMAYPREGMEDEYALEAVKLAAVVGGDLGADIIKTNYSPADPSGYKEVIKAATVDVVIAGGPKTKKPMEVLGWCVGARDAGGSGVSIGRNIFAQKPYERVPGIMMSAIYRIFVEKMDAEEAAEESGLNVLLKEL